jgi:hypothetical protein
MKDSNKFIDDLISSASEKKSFFFKETIHAGGGSRSPESRYGLSVYGSRSFAGIELNLGTRSFRIGVSRV